MSKQLLLKLCLVLVAGVVALFWIIDLATTRTEAGMSVIAEAHRQQITDWGKQAEAMYRAGDMQALEAWLRDLGKRENTWVAVASVEARLLAGEFLPEDYQGSYFLGRSLDWPIHLYQEDNPVMEVPFAGTQVGFLIRLPAGMRPGSNLEIAWLSLQFMLPMVLLGLVAFILYRHIMTPLRKLEQATRSFALGKFDTRVRHSLGRRSDELTELADTFDRMAERIGTLVVSQRQLIADVSHELRTPLTRLDIAVQNMGEGRDAEEKENLKRIARESANMRRLVDDSLTLAWLENERPVLQQESLDLTDLIDVLAEDARFEYPGRRLALDLPDNAQLSDSNHRSLGQALENILRNALRFTPEQKSVSVSLRDCEDHYRIRIEDEGGGVPEQDLERIFLPFYRSGTSRHDRSGFGLGLALAKRQIAAVGGVLRASNVGMGLAMIIDLPKRGALAA
jgi:two-component system sensor histidine kinase PfeS